MDKKERKYPAKLLLFGEHTVLKGSSSLAIPFENYNMIWSDRKADHPVWFLDYINYLSTECADFIDIAFLNKYINDFTIEANIPIGYGLGSSGALTAAIYDVSAKDKQEHLIPLQFQLGKMESFFHGQSSGFDPLISYCNQPIQKTTDEVLPLKMEHLSMSINCYLLDSGYKRSGKEMISQFVSNWDLKKDAMLELASLNDVAVNHILGNEHSPLFPIVKDISQLQLENMDYMILPELKDIWKEGLSSDEYFLKVCGAGGGGYYLVFSKVELENIGNYKLEKVHL